MTKSAEKPGEPRGHKEGWTKGDVTVSHLAEAGWENGLRSYFQYRDLGIAGATKGKLSAHVIRAVNGVTPSDTHKHALDFQMIYILKGWLKVHLEGKGEVLLKAHSSLYQPPGIVHKVLDYAPDVEILEITVPAEFATESLAP